MPADEVTRGTEEQGSRARTGPRHAAPRRPLFTRFHMPAGKAIASVAMPTAVIVGMGFTSTLALADNNGSPSPSTSAKSLTADEYKDCVKALGDDKNASGTPSPSASDSGSPDTRTPSPDDAGKDAKGTGDANGTGDAKGTGGGQDAKDSGKTSSPDSGSDDKATPKPTATSGSSGSGSSDPAPGSGGDTTTPATPAPTESKAGGGLLDTIGDKLGDLLTGGKKDDSGTSSATPAPSASPSSGAPSAPTAGAGTPTTGPTASTSVKDTASKAGKTVEDTVKNTTDKVTRAAGDAGKAAGDATASATPDPTPSASASTSAAKDCPAATDDESGVDNKTPVADDPWYLDASSLLLKGADYQGIVEVKTANGTKKKVLKYVISSGTDIGDLHQTVQDKQANKTYHVQASKGSTSTITDGDTVMYTESISGNLFGLIPVTFSPDSPPPLNIPLIYFTHVKVVQAAQFGGTLHIPGMHVYTTD